MPTAYYLLPGQTVIQLSVRGAEPSLPSLQEVSKFLVNLNCAFEIARLAVDPKYNFFRFSPDVSRRDQLPLAQDDRLRVRRIVHHSPIEVVTVVAATAGAIGALWALVQTAEKISNWRLNRRKLVAEVRKLEREERRMLGYPGVQAPGPKISEYSPELVEFQLKERQAMEVYSEIEQRLIASEVKIREVNVKVLRWKGRNEPR